MASGAYRQDFTFDDHLFPGEDRIHHWTMYDENGVIVPDLTGRQYTLYVLYEPRQPSSEAALTVNWGAGMSTSGSDVIATISSTMSAALIFNHRYFYKLSRSDAGNNRVVAYGWYPVIDGSEAMSQLR